MKITDKNSSRRYQRDNITSYLLVSNQGTGAQHITTSLVEMQKGGRQHIHSHATEQCYFILEGRGEMTVCIERMEVSAGMSIFIPSNQPHGLVNTTDGMLRYLSAGSPPFGKEEEVRLWPLPPLSEVPTMDTHQLVSFLKTPEEKAAYERLTHGHKLRSK